MKLKNAGAEIFVPDQSTLPEAIKRTTHMCIAAHQDDVELMAFDGALKCFGKKDDWFMAVVVTNGAGSPRSGLYADYSDEEMQNIRKLEQKKAAFVGEYGAVALLDYTSSEVKKPGSRDVIDELKKLITEARPEILYTHNLADKHDTHVGVSVKVIQALREIPPEIRPKKLYGCEVWRNLDWVNDDEKLSFDLSLHPNIAASLIEVHDSQVCGGKRYDLAIMGRRLSNATFSGSHSTDTTTSASYAMDLTPLMENDKLDIAKYISSYIERFREDVLSKIAKVL